MRNAGVDRLASRLRARISSSGRVLPSIRAGTYQCPRGGACASSHTWASSCSGRVGAGAGRRSVAMLEAKRTLVKSGPELWAEISDPGSLARHLTPFGSVRIVRTDPERLVAWEGEKAAGEVALAESGFGTRVTMTAAIAGAVAPEPEPEPL